MAADCAERFLTGEFWSPMLDTWDLFNAKDDTSSGGSFLCCVVIVLLLSLLLQARQRPAATDFARAIMLWLLLMTTTVESIKCFSVFPDGEKCVLYAFWTRLCGRSQCIIAPVFCCENVAHNRG